MEKETHALKKVSKIDEGNTCINVCILSEYNDNNIRIESSTSTFLVGKLTIKNKFFFSTSTATHVNKITRGKHEEKKILFSRSLRFLTE